MTQIPRLPREIRTERLILRPWRAEDALALYEAVDASRERVGAWLPWVQFYRDASAAVNFIELTTQQWAAASELPLAIFERASGRVLGGVGFHSTTLGDPIRWDWRTFETGYWLREGAEGKGYMREAMRAEMRLVFEHFGGRKLAIRCDARNDASRRVAESMGLRLDATMRNDSIATDGTLRNTLFFSILPDEAAPLLDSWKNDVFEVDWSDQPIPDKSAEHSEETETPAEAIAFPRPALIETDRLLLRPASLDDAPALLAMIERSRQLLEQWMPSFRAIRTLADAERVCANARADWEARHAFSLLAFERSGGELVGAGRLHDMSWKIPSVEIDWLLDATKTGQGYATEMGAAQLRFAMETWHAERVDVWCQSTNRASRGVAKRIGFIEEGILRQELPDANGALADWAVSSVIPADYERIAGGLPAVRIETA